MIQTKQIGSLTQLTATEGYIHKLGTDNYAKAIIMLASDTDDMYEEVAEIPPYTKAEYDAKVAELVRQKYSESEEFAIQRKMLNTLIAPMTLSEDAAESAMDEYNAYNVFVESCKADAPAAILEDIEKRRAEEVLMASQENTEGDEQDSELV